MSGSQSDCFFLKLDHAIIPVRATKFAEVEIGLKIVYTAHNRFQRASKLGKFVGSRMFLIYLIYA